MRGILAFNVLLWLSTVLPGEAAPSGPSAGPHRVVSGAYGYPATVDMLVLPDLTMSVDVRGQLWRPEVLSSPAPVIVVMPGNHQTCGLPQNGWRADISCEYTIGDGCPPPSVEVPTHLGFGYIAEKLASWGYVVVSINANRGINCNVDGVADDPHLIRARGALILRHLQLLSLWNKGLESVPESLGVSFKNKLDLAQIGLIGHSRGGEGARAAYHLYMDQRSGWSRRIPEVLGFRAILEITAVDRMTSRVLNAENVAWAAVTAPCDGDLWSMEVWNVFNRMSNLQVSEWNPSPKAIFHVVGANHNFFNTEWHVSDAEGCNNVLPTFSFTPIQVAMGEYDVRTFNVGSSPTQQAVALKAALALMRGNVGLSRQLQLNTIFDPSFALPQDIVGLAPIERAFLPSLGSLQRVVIADYEISGATSSAFSLPIARNVSELVGLDNYLAGINQELRHSTVSWASASAHNLYQVPFGPAGTSLNLGDFSALTMRLGRTPLASSEPFIDFQVVLVGADQLLSSAVHVRDFVSLAEPAAYGPVRPFLQTVLIPLSAFRARSNFLRSVVGVRFIFNQSSHGAVYLDDVGLMRGVSLGAQHITRIALPPAKELFTELKTTPELVREARIEAIRSVGNDFGVVLALTHPLPVGAAGAIVRIAQADFPARLRWVDPKDLSRVELRLDSAGLEAFQAARDGSSLKLQVGSLTFNIQ